MKEFSCGVILFTKVNGKREYVLVMEPSGSYGFPKGHVENNETDIECALRECREETGIIPSIIPNMKRTIKYIIPNNHNEKEVTYFVGEYDDCEIVPEDSNIMSAKKYDLKTCLNLIKFPQIRDILVEVDFMLDIRG